jgi:hypothetical protein
MNIKKIGVAILIAALVAAFFIFDLGRYLSLDYLKQSQDGAVVPWRHHPHAGWAVPSLAWAGAR